MSLRPCPFCGSVELVVYRRQVFFVQCRECHAEGPVSITSENDAREKWNRRYTVDHDELKQKINEAFERYLK